ncbi:23192_t:CDS:2, partial [Cetraspora pellucida]
DASVIIRLTNEGSTYYENLPSSSKYDFIKGMSNDIATAIKCDASRITIPMRYQYSNEDNGDQIFMRINIAQGDNRGAFGLASDLNETIMHKDNLTISAGATFNYIDQSNASLWDKYRFILIGIFIGVVLLLLLWHLACRRHYKEYYTRTMKKQFAIRNFLAICVSALIVVDIILDILFIAFHGKDEKWILPVSRELRENPRYKNWWLVHYRTALALSLLSGIDNEALNVASLYTGSFGSLSAPYSREANVRISYATTFIIIIEDIYSW